MNQSLPNSEKVANSGAGLWAMRNSCVPIWTKPELLHGYRAGHTNRILRVHCNEVTALTVFFSLVPDIYQHERLAAMKLKFVSLSGALLVFSPILVAQTAPPPTQAQPAAAESSAAPQQPTAVAEAPTKLVVKEGTDVKLKFAQDLSSKTAAEDDPVNLVLDEDLKVGDVVVAKAGAKAVGTVTHVKKAGMIGKAGELNMRLEYVLVGDARMKVRGTKGKEGQGKEGAVVALTVLFGPLGLIKHGKDVDIKEGTPLAAYVDQDFTVAAPK